MQFYVISNILYFHRPWKRR